MPVFQDYHELHDYFGKLFDQARSDPRIAPKIKDSNLVIQFRYTEPDGVVTINAAAPPSDGIGYFDVIWGEVNGLKPDVEMRMAADVAHQFWQGRVNLMAALARRQIVPKGPLPKILRLLPAVEPMYEMYPALLREMGRSDLIIPAA